MIDPMAKTISDTSLLKAAIKPMAKSHPKMIDTPISSRFFTRRKENTSNSRISVTAMEIAHWLSVFI